MIALHSTTVLIWSVIKESSLKDGSYGMSSSGTHNWCEILFCLVAVVKRFDKCLWCKQVKVHLYAQRWLFVSDRTETSNLYWFLRERANAAVSRCLLLLYCSVRKYTLVRKRNVCSMQNLTSHDKTVITDTDKDVSACQRWKNTEYQTKHQKWTINSVKLLNWEHRGPQDCRI